MSEEEKLKRAKITSHNSKKYWENISKEKRILIGKKISESKKIHFSKDDDEYIKTHTVVECKAHFNLSAKPILKRRRDLNISVFNNKCENKIINRERRYYELLPLYEIYKQYHNKYGLLLAFNSEYSKKLSYVTSPNSLYCHFRKYIPQFK